MMGAGDKDILLKSEDTVIVSEGRFFAYGDVARPGIYPMERNTTVLKAISLAGGIIKSGAYTQVKILRPKNPESGSETIHVNLKEIMMGEGDKDMVLKPEDTIIITQGKFYVYGEVTNPGVYPMEEDTSVLKAIAIAGGFTKYGSSSRVKLLRPNKESSGYETIKINIKDIMEGYSDSDAVLKPNDTVVVFEGII
jgi:polysaccharide export outer membrane protein